MIRPGFSFVIVLLITWSSSKGTCQQLSKVDSLKSILQHQTGKDRFETLNRLAVAFTDVDNNEAYRYARELYPLSLEMGDSLKITQAGLRMASVLRRLEKADSALLFFNRSIFIARRQSFFRELKYLTNGAGLVHVFQAHYRLALSMFVESLELRKVDGDDGEIAVAFTNIAVAYYKMRNYEKALSFFNQALKLDGSYNFENRLINRGYCKIYLSRELEGITDIQTGLDSGRVEFLSDASRIDIMINGYTGLGIGYFRLQKFELARHYLARAVKLARDQGNQRFVAEATVYLAKSFLKEQQIVSALVLLKDAEAIAKDGQYRELLITIYEETINVLVVLSDPKIARYQELLINLKGEVYTADLRENLLVFESDFRRKENLTILSNQNQAIALEKNVAEAQGRMLVVFGFVLIMILFLLVVSLRFVLLRRNLNLKLDRKVSLYTQGLQESIAVMQMKVRHQATAAGSRKEVVGRAIYSLKGLCSMLAPHRRIDMKNTERLIQEIETCR